MIDGIVADEEVEGVPVFRANTVMDSEESRRRVAQGVLDNPAEAGPPVPPE